jgi:acetyltransferase-like isoleucine patch superfamily enzyme
MVMDHDQHARSGQSIVALPVVIEDRVWICARALI